MKILFVHEVDWLKKVVFEIHSLSESLSLSGHQVYAIDYESMWDRNNPFDFGGLATREFENVARAYPGASVCLRSPGLIKIPGLSRLSAVFTQYYEIWKTIKEKGIDVIVLYGVATNGLQTIYLARKFNVPVVFRSIDILSQLVPYPPLRPITRFLEKKVYSMVDAILALTPKLSRYVIDLGAEQAKVQLLLPGVDTTMFRPGLELTDIRQKWNLDEKDQIIVFIGTLFEFSGLDAFIRQFPEVVKQIQEAKLLIVGDGPQRRKLEGIITGLGLQERVIITGFQPYQTMPKYINLATICINPFIYTKATKDIIPTKVLQYLACGKAVIATSLPGMRDVLPSEGCGVAYTNEMDGVLNEVLLLLKSTERRQQLEYAGLNYVRQEHDHKVITHKLEAELEKIIKEKHSGSRAK